MRTDVISCFRRELLWVKAKRALQDFTVAAGLALLFFVIVTAITSAIELFF